MSAARLAAIDLPEFGVPPRLAMLPPELYAMRLERTRERMMERGLDRLLVYADREHSANLSYLSGFDPRFEEAILIIAPDGDPAILVGNECFAMAGAAPLPMRRHLVQDLSLSISLVTARGRCAISSPTRAWPPAGASAWPAGRLTRAGTGWRHRPSWWTRCASRWPRVARS